MLRHTTCHASQAVVRPLALTGWHIVVLGRRIAAALLDRTTAEGMRALLRYDAPPYTPPSLLSLFLHPPPAYQGTLLGAPFMLAPLFTVNVMGAPRMPRKPKGMLSIKCKQCGVGRAPRGWPEVL